MKNFNKCTPSEISHFMSLRSNLIYLKNPYDLTKTEIEFIKNFTKWSLKKDPYYKNLSKNPKPFITKIEGSPYKKKDKKKNERLKTVC